MTLVAFCPEELDIVTLKEHSGRRKNEGLWSTWLKKRRKLWKDDTTTTHVKAEDDLIKTESSLDITEEDQKTGSELLDGKDRLAVLFDENSNSSINAITENNQGIDDNGQDLNENDSIDISNNNIRNYDSVGSCQLKKTPVFPMKQSTTLYLCYIGLRLLQEPVLLSDLMRWSHEGILPYHKASVMLPKEMKFAASDNKKFSSKKKLVCDFYASKNVALLYRTLGIGFAPDWEYIKLLAVPVLVDLEFSSVVQQLVCWLIDVDSKLSCRLVHRDTQKRVKCINRCVRDCHHCGKPILDFVVVAYIVVALKIIYYLDDVHEVHNETRNHLLQDLKWPEVEKWTSWVTRTMIKRAKKLYSGIPREENDLRYIHDLTVYENFCVKDVFQNFNIRVATQPYQNNMGTWRHRKDMTQQQDPRPRHFETYYSIARLVNSSLDLEKVERIGSSFPCSVDLLGNGVSCCDRMLKNDSFNHAATYCVVNSQGYNTLFVDDSRLSPENQVQDVHREHSLSVSSDESKNQNRGVDVMNVDFPSNLCIDATVSKERNIISKPSVELLPVDMNMSEGSTLANNVPASCDCYIHYAKSDGEDIWSDSYRYLMMVMAQRMETLPGELQDFVHALETRLFCESWLEISIQD